MIRDNLHIIPRPDASGGQILPKAGEGVARVVRLAKN